MKFVCLRDKLIEGINIVQKAVASRSTIPILDGILIEVNSSILLTGYDMEAGIEYVIDADVMETGSLVVNSRTFGDIIRKLPEDVVSFEVGPNFALKIESGAAKFTIKGQSAEEYPKLPVVEDAEKLVIKQHLLKDMIKQTIFAVGVDDSRPTLNGVYFKCQDKQLEIVAIDGFRLALRRLQFENDLPAISFIIPGKALNEVGKILSPALEDEIDVYTSKNHIMFQTEQVKVVARLITGEYFNYESILPKTAETTLTVSPQTLLAAVERTSLVIMSEDRRQPVRMTTDDDEILILSANTEIGTAKEEVPVHVQGDNIDVDFNPKYFIEALRVIEEDEISMVLNGSMGPSVLKPLEGDEFAYLILPLRR